MTIESVELDFQQAVFIEETALVTFMDPENPHYAKARSFFMDLDDLERHFVTTNYVIFGTHGWLRDRHGYAHAEFFLDTMEKTAEKGKLTIIPGNQDLEREAKRLLSQHPEFQFSLGEAMTAIVLLSFRIERIFTFNPIYFMLQNIYPDLKIIPSTI